MWGQDVRVSNRTYKSELLRESRESEKMNYMNKNKQLSIEIQCV